LELRAGPISGRGIATPAVRRASKSEFWLKIHFGLSYWSSIAKRVSLMRLSM
jgi:hypothetical protein